MFEYTFNYQTCNLWQFKWWLFVNSSVLVEDVIKYFQNNNYSFDKYGNLIDYIVYNNFWLYHTKLETIDKDNDNQ